MFDLQLISALISLFVILLLSQCKDLVSQRVCLLSLTRAHTLSYHDFAQFLSILVHLCSMVSIELLWW